MNNKEITLDQMYSMIKRGYISKFPHPFEQYDEMILYFFNNEAEIFNHPIEYNFSDKKDEKHIHIEVRKIKEKMLGYKANEQEKIIKIIEDLNSDMINIINDLEALHLWLINEGLIIQEDPTKYKMTKKFMELERIPL